MIKFVGENLTVPKNALPDGALKLEEGFDTLDIKSQIIFGIIALIIMFIIVFINKNKIIPLLKEEKENFKSKVQKKSGIKKIFYAYKILLFIVILSIIPIMLIPVHELIHAIVFGENVEIGFKYGYCIVNPLDLMNKFQYILGCMAPMFIFSILPFIIVNILLYKGKIKIIKYIIVVFISLLMLSSMLPDLIAVYNIAKYVPNNSIVQQIDGELYYY